MRKSEKLLKSDDERVKKNMFIALVVVTSFFLCAFLVCVWLVPTIGLSSIHRWLPYIVASFVVVGVGFILWGSLGLVFQVYTGKTFFGSSRLRVFTLNFLFPFMEALSRFLNISLKDVRRALIEVNNRLIETKSFDLKDILVLVPHCIQASRCKLRLTYNSDNCSRCGKCNIKDLLVLRDKWGVQLATATGGTMARNILKQLKPKLVIGVACERDLTSGLQDASGLPVIGVLNDCSKSVCMDTTVNVREVEAIIERFANAPLAEAQKSKGNGSRQIPSLEVYIPRYKDIVN